MSKEDKSSPEMQEWIELNRQLHIDQSTGKRYQENIGPFERFMVMFRENPLVPVGMALATGSLVIGLRKFTEGSKNQGFYMGARVGFQGLTIAALMYGAYVADKKRALALAAQNERNSKNE